MIVDSLENLPTGVDICAVITTFRPDGDFGKRVARIQEQVGLVVVVDDGDDDQNMVRLNRWFKDARKVHVHHNSSNVGIATSLNIGISIAKGKGYHWVLTLDDDSFIKSNFVENLINGLKCAWSNKPVGVIGMSWTERFGPVESKPVSENNIAFSEKRGLITSGSLFSTATYDAIGPFRDEFYMDQVDYDFCLRARAMGYAVIKLEEIGFEHSLGHREVLRFLGMSVVLESHDSFRVYYDFRNSTVLALEYLAKDPLYSVAVLIALTRKMLKIVLFEQDKKNKLARMCSGLKDGLSRDLGKKIQPQQAPKNRRNGQIPKECVEHR